MATATGIKTQPKKPATNYHKSKPIVRLMAARKDYNLGQTEEVNPIIYYQIPFPWIRIKLQPGMLYEMSGDGKKWIPAELPHVYTGRPSGCMQQGIYKFNEKDPLANITDYVVSYVQSGVKAFWEPLFKIKDKDSTHSSYYNPGLHPAKFMEAWESKTLDEILEYIKSKST